MFAKIDMNENILKLVDVVQKSTEFVDKGWGYYSTVTSAVVALMLGSDRVRYSAHLRATVAIIYGIFAIGNCLAIVAAQKGAIRWITLFNIELTKLRPPLPIEPMNSFPIWQLVLLHVFISTGVIFLILLSHKIKLSSANLRE